ncbi:MAG: amino acid permease, partial [Acidobacteria bacterium]|nr:amino acid permease [Acidobacteriota bacterium]
MPARTTQPVVGEERLVRGLGLKEATALNMIDMVGVGPFITIPLIIAAMGGPQAMLGWVVGAVLALCDGLVWAQLGAAMPHAGGTYVFLREAFGPRGWGRLLSFLFIWQMLFRAPLSMASGLIGFADYADYLLPGLVAADGGRTLAHRLLAGSVGLFIIWLLYRRISTIGRISLYLWVIVFGTIAWIILGGLTHFNRAAVLDFPSGAFDFWRVAFFAGLGNATLIAIYDYLGYQNVCYLGAEIREPVRVIPRAIIISILAIAVLYFVMNVSLISVIPWREAMTSKYIVSTFMERVYGPGAAQVVTWLI